MSTTTTTPQAAPSLPAPVDASSISGLPVTWRADDNTERYLNKLKVNWRLHRGTYLMRNIDFERSAANRARLAAPIDHERVAIMVQHSKLFPLAFKPLVLWTNDQKRGELIDGNHRAAFLTIEGIDTCWAYEVVGAGPDTIELLTKTFNSLEGVGQSPDEVMAHAVHYALGSGSDRSITEIAALFGVKAVTLDGKVKVMRARERFNGELPVRNHSRIPDSTLEYVLGLNYDSLVGLAARRLTEMEAMPTMDKVRRVVAAVKAEKRSEKDQEAVLKRELDRLEREVAASVSAAPLTAKAGRRMSLTPAQKFASEVGRLVKAMERYLPAGKSPKDLLVNRDLRESVLEDLNDLRKKVASVIKALNE